MSDRYSIHAPGEPQSPRSTTLLAMLEGIMPVKFSFSDGDQSGIAGRILTANTGGAATRSGTSVSSLSVPQVENTSKESDLIDFAVRFSDDPDVPFPFQGRSLRTKVAAQPSILSLGPDEKPLATCELGPVWAVSQGKAAKHFRSGFALPALPADRSLQDVLSGRRFLEMLPLLHWLRGVCAGASAVSPPLRACFIFDDPNLHWPRYGYVDYQQLAAQAEKENYHVAFATIPLDTWFTHGGTAGIFRKHRSRLSLLIHGNNHAKRELARQYTEPERIYLLKQAIHRIERLERRSGLAVSRVMVPPHGACSEEMLAALPVCGFEAACISHSSLRAHNKAKAWTKTLGYLPSELVRGCPVLPRWGVSGDLKNTILLAAYLKQAIILRGHHQDLKDGPELLDELARFVNGLGLVEWLNMTDLVRTNYSAGSVEARQIAEGVTGSILKPSFGGVVNVEKVAGTSFEVVSQLLAEVKTHARPRAPVWFIRRLLTEGRDRLLSSSGR
jgi:hypothetical protein